MLSGGILAIQSESAFGEMVRNDEYIPLVPGYFKKVVEMFPEIKNEKECLVVIWVNDLPVKILFVEQGQLSSNTVLEKSNGKGVFEIIDMALSQNIPVYDAE
jgi:hypothetical protein